MNHDSPIELPHQLRERTLRRLLRVLGADCAQYYMVARSPDLVLRIHGIRGVNANAAATARWAGGDGLAFVVSETDPDEVAPLNRLASPLPGFYDLPMVRFAFGDVGYHAVLYTNVSLGDRHRGLVAFARAAPGPWEVEPGVLASACRAVVKTFRAAWEEEERLAAPTGTLQLGPDGAPSGTPALVAWARQHGVRRWRGRPSLDTPLGESPYVWAPAAFAEVLPLEDGGQIVSFKPASPMVLPPMMTQLSDVLRRVAALAAAGATVAEIATATDRSPDTVRESLSRIYEKLGISSRAELAVAARRMLV